MMFLLTLVAVVVRAEDYCSISPRHTACPANNPKGPGPSCRGAHLARGVSPREIEEILQVHNRYRAKVARGEERRGKPGPQPPATNMRQMTWDPELALVAQAHADQCKFQHDCSDCRRVDRFGVGQNLYIYKQSLKRPANDWEKGIRDWYEEVTLFSSSNVEPFKFSSPTGHYTALAWADTHMVGCGATSYKDGKWFATLYTCNYGPVGNYIRGQMYEAGPACSACPLSTTCSSAFPGLCSSSSNATSPSLPKVAPAPRNSIQALLPGAKDRKNPVKSFRTTTARTTTTARSTTTARTTTTVQTTTRKTTRVPRTTTARQSTTRQTTISKEKAITSTTSVQTIRTTKTAARNPSPRLNPSPFNLFNCEFNRREPSCKTRNSGGKWSPRQASGNTFTQLQLEAGDKSEFFFQQLIEPPTGGIACLDFRYKKLSPGDRETVLSVFAWPRQGKPGRVNVAQDSPDAFTWVRAQVTFRNVDQQFLVMFRVKNEAANEPLLLAVDDVLVTEGACRGAV